MIRQLGCACNANPAIPEWVAVREGTATDVATIEALAARAVNAPAPAPIGLAGFDTSAAGVTYDGQPVASWIQVALGLLALRNL